MTLIEQRCELNPPCTDCRGRKSCDYSIARHCDAMNTYMSLSEPERRAIVYAAHLRWMERRLEMIEKESISLPDAEILAQLAEEASELAQAALKLRRAITGLNPTPVTAKEAEAAVIEEVSDVLLCCQLLDIDASHSIMAQKKERWRARLSQRKVQQ